MCHFYTFSIVCLSLFQIQNLCQFWLKKGHPIQHFNSSFLLLASFKSKIGNVLCPAIFLHFRRLWCIFKQKYYIIANLQMIAPFTTYLWINVMEGCVNEKAVQYLCQANPMTSTADTTTANILWYIIIDRLHTLVVCQVKNLVKLACYTENSTNGLSASSIIRSSSS